MENKQTAVEWLVNYMEENFHLTDDSRNVFEQAKQMEKEQIMYAFGEKRQFMGFGDNDTFGITEKTGQEYYNETYGK